MALNEDPNTGSMETSHFVSYARTHAYPGLGVVAPTRQMTSATSEKKKMRKTPIPRPMTRVSPFSVSPSVRSTDDMSDASPVFVPPTIPGAVQMIGGTNTNCKILDFPSQPTVREYSFLGIIMDRTSASDFPLYCAVQPVSFIDALSDGVDS